MDVSLLVAQFPVSCNIDENLDMILEVIWQHPFITSPFFPPLIRRLCNYYIYIPLNNLMS
ncbi:hypothetical protein LCGC14_0837190 [marine sediment metagenome]|uniref:Uncharacterized protein n=1 Tax=marine sediment metagenome TaxID=412755 RepID=A0A0F9PZH4_9ZZZZ